jgi:hypothetical protein
MVIGDSLAWQRRSQQAQRRQCTNVQHSLAPQQPHAKDHNDCTFGAPHMRVSVCDVQCHHLWVSGVSMLNHNVHSQSAHGHSDHSCIMHVFAVQLSSRQIFDFNMSEIWSTSTTLSTERSVDLQHCHGGARHWEGCGGRTSPCQHFCR